VRKTRYVGVRLTPTQWEKLEKIAARRGTNISRALRHLVDNSGENANSRSAKVLAGQSATAVHA